MCLAVTNQPPATGALQSLRGTACALPAHGHHARCAQHRRSCSQARALSCWPPASPPLWPGRQLPPPTAMDWPAPTMGAVGCACNTGSTRAHVNWQVAAGDALTWWRGRGWPTTDAAAAAASWPPMSQVLAVLWLTTGAVPTILSHPILPKQPGKEPPDASQLLCCGRRGCRRLWEHRSSLPAPRERGGGAAQALAPRAAGGHMPSLCPAITSCGALPLERARAVTSRPDTTQLFDTSNACTLHGAPKPRQAALHGSLRCGRRPPRRGADALPLGGARAPRPRRAGARGRKMRRGLRRVQDPLAGAS